MNRIALYKAGLLVSALALGACAHWTPPPDQINQQLADRHPDVVLTADNRQILIDQLLGQPLTPHNAVQVMLLNSPHIQRLLAELGVANAQRAQAELLSNPHFAVGALRPEGGGRWQLDFGLSQSLLDIFTRSLRVELAEASLLQRQLVLQLAVDDAIHELQQAFFAAVAAHEQWEIYQYQQEAADAAYALAQAMHSAGTLAESAFLQHRFAAQDLARHTREAQLKADTTQLKLVYLLGLPTGYALILPEHLPDIPQETFAAHSLIAQALEHRLDLRLSRQQQAVLNRQQPIITRSRWTDMRAGIKVEREFDGSIHAGPELELGLPLFDSGKAKIAALSAQTEAAKAHETHLLRKAEHEITLALRQLAYARSLQQQTTALQDTARQQLDQRQREVNFMLASPFDLLNLKQQEIRLAAERVEALQLYWQARTALTLAIGKSLPTPELSSVSTPARATETHDHSHHHHGSHHHD